MMPLERTTDRRVVHLFHCNEPVMFLFALSRLRHSSHKMDVVSAPFILSWVPIGISGLSTNTVGVNTREAAFS